MPALSTTSFALLGLLSLDDQTRQNGMTGYELKQRADRTMRFYWTSPAMSQIYTELDRLADAGLVTAEDSADDQRRARRFTLSEEGLRTLKQWLSTPPEDSIPVLKHPVALRLMLGSMTSPESMVSLLDGYLEQLEARREELQQVRTFLADHEEVRYPARVAEWGLAYFDSEREITERLRSDVEDRG